MNRLDITTVEAARIHAGIPTEVRRPVENPPRFWSFMDGIDGVAYPTGYRQVKPSLTGLFIWSVDCRNPQPARTAPLGKPGDLLWTAEEWAAHWMYNDVGGSDCRSGHDGDNYWYRADGDDSTGSCGLKASGYRGTWRAADTMPQWASRATVRLTAVRAERTGDTWEWVYSVERSE
jgi:hypothetical protein